MWNKCSKKLPLVSGSYYVKCIGDRISFYTFCPYDAEQKKWIFANRDSIIKWKPMFKKESFWSRIIFEIDSNLISKSIFW